MQFGGIDVINQCIINVTLIILEFRLCLQKFNLEYIQSMHYSARQICLHHNEYHEHSLCNFVFFSVPSSSAFSLPVGVRILKVYLTHAEYESLLADRPRQTHCAVSQFSAKDMSNKLYAMRGSLLQNNTELSMTKSSIIGDGDSSVNNDLSNIQTVGCLSGSTPSNRNVSKNISSIEQGQAEPKTSNTPSVKSTEDTFTNHKIKTIFDSGSGDEGKC